MAKVRINTGGDPFILLTNDYGTTKPAPALKSME